MINDLNKPNIVELDFEHGIKACEEYVLESIRKTNVTFSEHAHFKIYPLKDIEKDEELFLHYGYKCWLTGYDGNFQQ